ncbi:hypothetical protein VCR12J2_1030077 [Vibrio coralliirubri]|nr:hypothetical protein VCR12J2_1030077 [Vibrio coralliirubri]
MILRNTRTNKHYQVDVQSDKRYHNIKSLKKLGIEVEANELDMFILEPESEYTKHHD